jgi:hypothetical protein
VFLWIVIGILFILDIFTTSVGVKAGATEVNPVMVNIAKYPIAHIIIKLNAYAVLMCSVEIFAILLKHLHLTSGNHVVYYIWYGSLVLSLVWVVIFYSAVVYSNITEMVHMGLL